MGEKIVLDLREIIKNTYNFHALFSKGRARRSTIFFFLEEQMSIGTDL